MSEDEKRLKARVAQLEEELREKKLVEAHKANQDSERQGSSQALLEYDVMEVLKKGIDLKVF